MKFVSRHLHRPALVLNKGWTPVDVLSIRDALVKVFADGALLINITSTTPSPIVNPTPDDFVAHDWESWIEQPVGDNMPFVATTSIQVKLLDPDHPTLIVLAKNYAKVPSCEVKLTRANLLTRDRHRCAYTSEKLRLSNATIDHIVPTSRGGTNTWDNVVIASESANRRKGNRTPSEAGMRLRCKPFKPRWSPLFSACLSTVPDVWLNFIDPEKVLSPGRLVKAS